jgi:hypothetical protein
VVSCKIDRGNSASYKGHWTEDSEIQMDRGKNGINLSKYDRICRCEER